MSKSWEDYVQEFEAAMTEDAARHLAERFFRNRKTTRIEAELRAGRRESARSSAILEARRLAVLGRVQLRV